MTESLRKEILWTSSRPMYKGLDFLRKTLIGEYVYSNIDEDRNCTKSVRINGRLYDKHGVDCATTAVAFLYKVPVFGVKQFKTVILVGIARQNPCDLIISKNTGIEEAKKNALMDPVAIIEYNQTPQDSAIMLMLQSYVVGLPVQMIKTTDEIKLQEKDLTKYSRQQKPNKYYDEYYKEAFEKIRYYRGKIC